MLLLFGLLIVFVLIIQIIIFVMIHLWARWLVDNPTWRGGYLDVAMNGLLKAVMPPKQEVIVHFTVNGNFVIRNRPGGAIHLNQTVDPNMGIN